MSTSPPTTGLSSTWPIGGTRCRVSPSSRVSSPPRSSRCASHCRGKASSTRIFSCSAPASCSSRRKGSRSWVSLWETPPACCSPSSPVCSHGLHRQPPGGAFAALFPEVRICGAGDQPPRRLLLQPRSSRPLALPGHLRLDDPARHPRPVQRARFLDLAARARQSGRPARFKSLRRDRRRASRVQLHVLRLSHPLPVRAGYLRALRARADEAELTWGHRIQQCRNAQSRGIPTQEVVSRRRFRSSTARGERVSARAYTLVYDGDCRFCVRSAKLVASWDREGAVELVPHCARPGR